MIAVALFLVQAAASAAVSAQARGTLVADTLWSQALGTNKQVVVYLPPSYASAPRRLFPVAYYLHGLTGRETDWTEHGRLHLVMDSLVAAGGPEMIVVMPDGDDGWYTTWNSLPGVDTCRRAPPAREKAESYCVPWPHYDDYVARDVVGFIDRRYRTRASRASRAIAGLSMGGYGATSLAFSYPDVFVAAASHSGVLAPLFAGPRPLRGEPVWVAGNDELARGWGRMWPALEPVFGRDTAMWWSRDPGRKLERLVRGRGRPAVPAIFVDVGTEDELADESRAFRWRADSLGVPLTYHEWPGKHDWPYWRAHVGESLAWIAAHVRP